MDYKMTYVVGSESESSGKLASCAGTSNRRDSQAVV